MSADMNLFSKRSRTTNRLKAGTALVLIPVAVLGMAACSSDDADDQPSDDSIAGQLIGPVIVEPDQDEVTVSVGRVIVFNAENPQDTVAVSDDDSVVTTTDGYDDGSAVFNPGAEARAVGTAEVTLTDSVTGTEWVVTVTVTE